MAHKLPSLLLLLFIGFGCIANTFGQRLAVPRRRLMPPTLPFAESFERFDSIEDEEDDEMQRTQEEIRELLGQQLTSAVTPLTVVPLLGLTRRQPGIVAPQSGAAAALRFADYEPEESSDEDSDEGDGDTETGPVPGQEPVTVTVTVPQVSAAPQFVTVPQSVVQSTPQAVTPSIPQVVAQPVAQFVPPPLAQPAPQTVQQSQSQSDYNPYRDNFNDQNSDGSYVFGYSLPNGVRRWERGFQAAQRGLVVEGFSVEPRHYGASVRYELRCYRADYRGYQPLMVEYLSQPPRVRRFEVPTVSCFNANRLRRLR